MYRSVRTIGLALSSLTVATVALAQLGGNGAVGEHARHQARDAETVSARLTRPLERRQGTGCRGQTCSEPLSPSGRPVRVIRFDGGCDGSDVFSYRDYDGRTIEASCAAR